MLSEKETEERYTKLVEVLATAVDVEMKRHVLELIENGFAPFDLESLGAPTSDEYYGPDTAMIRGITLDLMARFSSVPKAYEVIEEEVSKLFAKLDRLSKRDPI